MVEIDEAGQVIDPVPAERLVRAVAFADRLQHRGCRPKSGEWQFMQVFVGGMPAKEECSTEVWQYRQSMPKTPA